MTLGLSIESFLVLHVAISMVALFAGFIVLGGMLSNATMPGWTAFFLVTTLLTSVTGFMFPPAGFTPAIAVGALSVLLLIGALAALYARRLSGRWRTVYALCALAALYLNTFVFVVQSFQKVGFLQALAPTQSEPAFAMTQAALLLAFVAVGISVMRRFRPMAA